MSFKKNIVLILGLFFGYIQAQDYNFSQFYNTPIVVNPAQTGKFEKDFRIGLIHRSAYSTYTNSALMADVNFQKSILKSDMFGLGLVVYNDQQGNGQFNTSGFLLSAANHYALDDMKQHKLSFGLQLGMSFGNFNRNNLLFPGSFNTATNEPTETVNVPTNQSKMSIYTNFGAFYDFNVNRKLDLFLGASLFNISGPKQGFSTNNNAGGTPLKIGLQAGFSYFITEKFQILPAVNLFMQSGSKDLILGSNFSYYLINNAKTGKKASVTFGLWHRLSDSFIAYLGFKYNSFQLGFSYDFTVSALGKSGGNIPNLTRSFSTGAWEISLIYSGFLNRAIPDKTTVPCRTF